MTGLGIAFAAGQATALLLLLAPQLLIRRHPHRSPVPMTDPPAWQPPARLPTRRELQPLLPVDLAALVKAGHVVAVNPGQYREATPGPPSRQDHDVDPLRGPLAVQTSEVSPGGLSIGARRPAFGPQGGWAVKAASGTRSESKRSLRRLKQIDLSVPSRSPGGPL